MYYKYNDYELIYLIKEGNSSACDMLYQKYYPLMFKMIKAYHVSYNLFEDLLQEARMKLLDAINSYSDFFACSFFKYFSLLLSRMLNQFCKYNKFDLRFKPTLRLNDEYENLSAERNEFIEKVISLTRMLNFKKDIDEKLFYECVVEGFSLIGFAEKYSVEYYTIRLKYNKLIKEIKKILTNL